METRELEVLNELVAAYLDTGTAQTTQAVSELMHADPSAGDTQAVRRLLVALAETGHVQQLYPRGPWRPLRDSDGLRVRTVVTLEGP